MRASLWDPSLPAGTIVTIAGSGSGTPTYSGDGGPATAAKLNLAQDATFDAAGNLWIVDRNNARVRLVNGATGIITTAAGTGATTATGDGGQASLATLNPTGIAVDAGGNVFITTNNHRIRRIDAASGIITTVAGTGVAGYPTDAQLAAVGYAANAAKIYSPMGIALEPDGGFVFVDSGNHRVRRVRSNGSISYVTDGGGGTTGDGGLAILAKLSEPQGVARDDAGNLWIADKMNYRVRFVNAMTQIISTVAGTGSNGYTGDGGLATLAKIGLVMGVAVDSRGNLWLSDGFSRIRFVDALTGIIATRVGSSASGFSGDGGPASSAVLSSVRNIRFDAAGNLLLADVGNNRIRLVVGADPPPPPPTPSSSAAETVSSTASSSQTGTPSSTQTATSSSSQTGTASSSQTGTASSSQTGTPSSSAAATESSMPATTASSTAAITPTGTPIAPLHPARAGAGADAIAWPGAVAAAPGGLLVPGYPAGSPGAAGQLFLKADGGSNWAALASSGGANPGHLSVVSGLSFYAAGTPPVLWVASGANARAVRAVDSLGAALTLSAPSVVVALPDAAYVAAGGDTIYRFAVTSDMASATAGATTLTAAVGVGATVRMSDVDLGGASREDPTYTLTGGLSQPRVCAGSNNDPQLYFYGYLERAGVATRALLVLRPDAPGAPLEVAAVFDGSGAPVPVEAALDAAPQCVGGERIAFITAAAAIPLTPAGRVALALPKQNINNVRFIAPQGLPYTGAFATTWVGAGLCFIAVTSQASAPELLCAGVATGDLNDIQRSASPSGGHSGTLRLGAKYLAARGHVVYTGCVPTGAPGGPHLCAFNGATGALASSWGDANQVALPYNALAVVGTKLFFAAQAPADAAAGLWVLELGA